MKRLILSVQRVRALLLSNKLISALYLIGGILAVFSMFFMYMTLISQDKYEAEEWYYTYSLYSASGAEDNKFTLAAGRDAAASLADCMDKNDNIRCSGLYSDLLLGDICPSVSENYKEMLVRILVPTDGKYVDTATDEIDLYTSCPSGEDYPIAIPSSLLSVLLPNASADPTDAKITILGKEHVLTNIHGENTYYLIMLLPDDPCAKEIKYNGLTVITKYPLSGAEVDRLEELGEKLFNDPEVDEPYTPYKEYLDMFLSNILMIAAFTAVAMIAFAFLFTFMLESRADELRIMMLCGASRFRTCMFVLSDAFTVNLFTGLIAVLLFSLTKDKIFSNVVNTTMHSSDYLIVLVCFLAVSLLVCSPMLYTHATNTITEMRRKYKK